MRFAEALEVLKAGGAVKLPHWEGFWKREGDTIMMRCCDGRILDIRKTEDVFYTLQNIASDEWMVSESYLKPGDKTVLTMRFGEALREVKQGHLIARKGWNGKNMAVAYQPGYPDGIPCNKNTSETWHIPEGTLFKCRPYLQMRCVDGTYQMWLASQSDILADDWYIVE